MVFRATVGKDMPCVGCCDLTAARCFTQYCADATFPPPGVTVGISGFAIAAGLAECGDCSCYNDPGLAACLNRTFELGRTTVEVVEIIDPINEPLYGGGGAAPITRPACHARWENTCRSTFSNGPDASGRVGYETLIAFDVYFFFEPLFITRPFPILLPPYFYARLSLRGHELFAEGVESSTDCEVLASWTHAYVFGEEAFPCAGPWSLQRDTGLDSSSCSSGGNDVSVAALGTSPPTETTGCCDASYTDDCLAVVLPPPTFCVPSCGDSGTNSGVPGEDVHDVTGCCAKGETLAATLNVAITGATFCNCLEATFGVSWDEGKKAWVGSFPACGHFVTVGVYCLGGTFCLRIECFGTVIASPCGTFACDLGCTCSPLSITWTISTPVSPCCALASSYLVHVFE